MTMVSAPLSLMGVDTVVALDRAQRAATAAGLSDVSLLVEPGSHGLGPGILAVVWVDASVAGRPGGRVGDPAGAAALALGAKRFYRALRDICPDEASSNAEILLRLK